MIVITSSVAPGYVYCSRSVCYLPQGLSVECLNLQAPPFWGPEFFSPPTPVFTDPKVVVFPEGYFRPFKAVPKTPSPNYAQVLVTKRRKRRPECVAPRATEASQISYSMTMGSGSYTTDLKALQKAGLNEDLVGSGISGGYAFSISGSSSEFSVQARPLVFGSTGTRSFYSDQTGIIRYTETDGMATSSSLPLNQDGKTD